MNQEELKEQLKFQGFGPDSVLRYAFMTAYNHVGDMIDKLLDDQALKSKAHCQLAESFQTICKALDTRYYVNSEKSV